MSSHGEGPTPGLLEASERIQEHSKRLGSLRRIQVVLVTLGLIILSCEVGFRLLGLRAKDYQEWAAPGLVGMGQAGFFAPSGRPASTYELQPGAAGEFYGAKLSISPDGLRGPGIEAQKAAAQKRLLVLGDGLAFGLGVEFEASLGEQLVKQAKAAGSNAWQALNLGIPGYALPQSLALLQERGEQLEPDLLLLYFNLSELTPQALLLDADGGLQRDHLPLPDGLKRLLWKSDIYALVASQHRVAMERGALPAWLQSEVPGAWTAPENQAQALRDLGAMASWCEAHEIPFYVLDQPIDAEAEGQAAEALDGLASWCKDARQELGIAGLTLPARFLAPGSALPGKPGLSLDAEDLASAAQAAFNDLSARGLMP